METADCNASLVCKRFGYPAIQKYFIKDLVEMEKAKVSFGFSKVARKTNLLPVKQAKQEESKVELIKCLEGQEIKLVEEKKEAPPLVIPLVSNQRTSTALASLLKRRAVLLGEDENDEADGETAGSTKNTNSVEINLDGDSLEKRAARELLAEMKNQNASPEKTDLVVPVVKPDDLPLEGAKQSTLDDYESIPIQQFGTAMLRGMGWVEPPKKKKANATDTGPILRPKGMGLGADKAIRAKPLLIPPENNEVLEIRKQAYVRILAGKFKDLYGQIQGFDDHAGRIIVKMAIGGTQEAFNEFLCQPVSKKEFGEYGRCINTDEYKKLKELENANGQIILKKEIKDESYDKPEKFKSESNDRQKDEKKFKFDKAKTDAKVKVEKYEDNSQFSYSRTYNDAERQYKSGRSRKSRSPESRYRSREIHSCSELRQNIRKKFELTDDSSKSDNSSARNRESAHKKSKKKSKKSESRKKSHKKYSSSLSEDTSASSDDEYAARQKHRNRMHKKKTKKSKRERSRSRSRGRR